MYCDLWSYVLWPLDFQILKRIVSVETIWGNMVWCSSSYIFHCNPMVHICSVHKFHCSPKYIHTSLRVQLHSFVVVSDAQKIYIISFSLSHFLHNQLFYPKLQRNWKGFGVVIDSSQNSLLQKSHLHLIWNFLSKRLHLKRYGSAIVEIRAAAGFSNPGGLAVMWWA